MTTVGRHEEISPELVLVDPSLRTLLLAEPAPQEPATRLVQVPALRVCPVPVAAPVERAPEAPPRTRSRTSRTHLALACAVTAGALVAAMALELRPAPGRGAGTGTHQMPASVVVEPLTPPAVSTAAQRAAQTKALEQLQRTPARDPFAPLPSH